MKKLLIKRLLLIVTLSLFFIFLNSSQASEVGKSGANFLKLEVGNRAVSLGGAYTGLGDDVFSIFFNPGGLGRAKNHEFTFMYNQYLEDIHHGLAAYLYPTRYYGVYGLSLIYLDSGKINELIINPNGAGYKETGQTFSTSQYCVVSSFGYQFNKKLSTGFNLKFIKGKLADCSSNLATALDFGIIYTPFKRLNLGLSLQNAGTKIKYLEKSESDPLPFTLRIGTALKLVDDNLIVALDVVKFNDNKINIHAGLEGNILGLFSLRTGYQVGSDDLWSYAVGFGVKAKGICFDYAFKPAEDFGNTHRISLGFKFGGITKEDGVIDDYDEMREKEEEILKKEREQELKGKSKKKIKEKDLDLYEKDQREIPRKMKKESQEKDLEEDYRPAPKKPSKEDYPQEEDYEFEEEIYDF